MRSPLSVNPTQSSSHHTTPKKDSASLHARGPEAAWSPSHVMQMQRAVGNKAVLQMLNSQTMNHSPETNAPAQMKWQYSPTRAIDGKSRTVYYHSSFDDDNINSLHVTFADTQDYDSRTWAIRSSYTPNSRAWGSWTAPVVNKGNEASLNQQGISTLIQSKIGIAQSAARADFIGNEKIKNTLIATFPEEAAPVIKPSVWGAPGGSGGGLASKLASSKTE